MEMNNIYQMPQRPPLAYHNDNDDDYDVESSQYPRSPSQMSGYPRSPSQSSFVSRADSAAPLGSASAFKCDIMIKFLRQRQMEKLWSNSVEGEGVILKRGKRDFVCQPSELLFEQNGLFAQVSQLNVKVSNL